MNRDELRQKLLERIADLSAHLLPTGKRIGQHWCVGDVNGAPGDSFKICLSGPKVGMHGDFADSEKHRSSPFDLWSAVRRVDFKTALRESAEWLGVTLESSAKVERPSGPKTATNGTKPNTGQPFNWDSCVDAFTDERVAQLAAWRGYSLTFCHWLREQALVGLYNGCVAFPVHDASGATIGPHYRIETGDWLYLKGTPTRPLIIGNLATALQVHAFESQWDAFDVLDKWFEFDRPDVAFLVTRGAGNGALVAGLIRSDAVVFAWPQNDPEGKRDVKTGKTPAESWLANVGTSAGCRVRSVLTPPEHEDPNAWGTAGATADDYLRATGVSKIIAEKPRALIEFRTPLQLKSYVPPPGFVLVGDCHIVRGAIFVIGGPPGVGKSRSAVSLAVAGATGLDWFGLKVHRKFKTLIIQNENGEFRLSKDFAALDCEMLEPWMRVCPPPPFGVCFDREEFRATLAKVIAEFQQDVILLDPWNAVARDDKAKDYLETFDLIRSVIPAGDDGPALGIVAHTRKPSSDERASGRGLLKTLAGSYALGSVPRCVWVMQAASDAPEDNRVVWTCCKNNDGELGGRSAWVRCNGLFAPVSDFDWDEFDNPSKGGDRVTITESHMRTVFENGARELKRADAAKALEAEPIGAGRSAAYSALELDGRFASHLVNSNGLLSWR